MWDFLFLGVEKRRAKKIQNSEQVVKDNKYMETLNNLDELKDVGEKLKQYIDKVNTEEKITEIYNRMKKKVEENEAQIGISRILTPLKPNLSSSLPGYRDWEDADCEDNCKCDE